MEFENHGNKQEHENSNKNGLMKFLYTGILSLHQKIILTIMKFKIFMLTTAAYFPPSRSKILKHVYINLLFHEISVF